MTLERLGWKFARIRGGEFFRDPDKALQSLWSRLTELGITPQESDATEPQSSVLEEIRLLTKKYLEKVRGPVIETAPPDFEQSPQSDGNEPGGSSEAESRKARVEPPPFVEVQSEEALRIALLRLRDGVIMRAHPEVPRERGLLRMRMLQALIRHLPTSVEEFDRVIPKVLRDETEPLQLRYLPQVIQVIADHVSGKSGTGQSALFK